MVNYFEGVVVYLEDGAEKKTSKVYMIDALSFSEAEASVTKFMSEWEDVNEFVLKSLKRVGFDDLVYRMKEQDDYDWYEAKVEMELGDGKKATFRYLVADTEVKHATAQLNKFCEDSEGDYKITSIKEKAVADIIIRKKCCEECDTCDTLYKIVSFEEQKEIDGKTNFLQQRQMEDLEFKTAIGAVEVTRLKYKIPYSDEILPDLKGKVLGRRVVKKWDEEFIDEDTKEVVNIERSEVVVHARWGLSDGDLELIKDAKPEFLWIYRD